MGEVKLLFMMFVGLMGIFCLNISPMMGMIYLLVSTTIFTTILLIVKGSFVGFLFFLSTISGLFILFSIFMMSMKIKFFSKTLVLKSKIFFMIILSSLTMMSMFSSPPNEWGTYLWLEEQILSKSGLMIWIYVFLIFLLLLSLPIVDQILKDISSSNRSEKEKD
uniref:NADH dehydrogenase subunit 6 n=1 Tax=Bothriometopus macrocnemis TaxID=475769 RepID=A8VU19_9NEOP|nr:NADH dehydrogenase subunit 6 [Bothriometopus macrocnemis]ABW20541.1 NADH dehydrogenase subunit 6 [Bothriometopus macrocnemis]UTT72564.1 NADH dehydrogenase subunit 6 [Bothriometopus macrocnemis]